MLTAPATAPDAPCMGLGLCCPKGSVLPPALGTASLQHLLKEDLAAETWRILGRGCEGGRQRPHSTAHKWWGPASRGPVAPGAALQGPSSAALCLLSGRLFLLLPGPCGSGLGAISKEDRPPLPLDELGFLSTGLLLAGSKPPRSPGHTLHEAHVGIGRSHFAGLSPGTTRAGGVSLALGAGLGGRGAAPA